LKLLDDVDWGGCHSARPGGLKGNNKLKKATDISLNMKKTILTILALAAAQAAIAEIDSRVIHNYSSVGLSYSYLHDIGNSGVDAHGFTGSFSYDYRNFLFGVNGGYWKADEDFGVGAALDGWGVGGSVGYVFRLAGNHVNIIPSFGAGYSESLLRVPGAGRFVSDVTAIQPSIVLSYALNNRVSVHTGYMFSYDVDRETDSHGLLAGTRVALLERLGLTIGALFVEGRGFSALQAGLSWHY
jgi:hypothetical protein